MYPIQILLILLNKFYIAWKAEAIIYFKCCNFQVEIYRTGGGPDAAKKVDELDLKTAQICKGHFEPLSNATDSDTQYINQVTKPFWNYTTWQLYTVQ